MIKKEVYGDFGSIKLIHRSGAALVIAHDGENEDFCAYLCRWGEVRDIKGLRMINTSLESGEGWRVMRHDCARSYGDSYAFDLMDERIDICIDADNNIYFIYFTY